MNSKFAKRLAAASKNWKNAKSRAAEAGGGGFEEIEDGRYLARLTDVEIGEAKSSGRLQVVWKYKIAEGDYKGQVKFAFDGLETEDNLMYLARTLIRYGYEMPDDISDIEEILKDLSKSQPLVRIRLKTRGEFQNCYVDNVFGEDDEDEALADARAEASEDDGGDEETDESSDDESSDEDESGDDEDESSDEDESGDDEDESDDEDEADEEESDDEDEDQVELKAGLKVVVPSNGKKVPGTVVEVLEKEDKVRVKLDSGKVIRVKIEELEAGEDEADEDDDIPAAPAKKPAKKDEPAKKTSKKPEPVKKGKKR